MTTFEHADIMQYCDYCRTETEHISEFCPDVGQFDYCTDCGKAK